MTNAERVHSEEEVRALFKIRPDFKYMENELIDMVTSSGAIIKGHFVLESGLHTPYFFRFADLSSRLDRTATISGELVSKLLAARLEFDAIVVQPSSGRFLAYMIAERLGKRLIVARVNEKNQPTGEYVNEIDLHPNDRVLIVEDLATTGSSMETLINTLRKRKARPVAIMLFATRNEKKMNEFAKKQNLPLIAVGDLAFEGHTVEREECELCPEDSIPSWEV